MRIRFCCSMMKNIFNDFLSFPNNKKKICDISSAALVWRNFFHDVLSAVQRQEIPHEDSFLLLHNETHFLTILFVISELKKNKKQKNRYLVSRTRAKKFLPWCFINCSKTKKFLTRILFCCSRIKQIFWRYYLTFQN